MLKAKNFLISTILLLYVILIPINANASIISPYTYNDTRTVTFQNNYTSGYRYYEGNSLTILTSATSSDGVSHEIILSVYIRSTNTTKKYRIYSDGVSRKASNIPLNGGSNVSISVNCSDSSVPIQFSFKCYS